MASHFLLTCAIVLNQFLGVLLGMFVYRAVSDSLPRPNPPRTFINLPGSRGVEYCCHILSCGPDINLDVLDRMQN